MKPWLLAGTLLLATTSAHADLFEVTGGNLTGTLFITDISMDGQLFFTLPPPPPDSEYAAGNISLFPGSPIAGGFAASGTGANTQVDVDFIGNLSGGSISGTWRSVLETCSGSWCSEHWVTFGVWGNVVPVNATPLPGTLALFLGALGIGGLLLRRRRSGVSVW